MEKACSPTTMLFSRNAIDYVSNNPLLPVHYEDQNAISMADPVISSLKKMKILVGLRVSWASKSKGVFRLDFVQTMWKLMQK
ncbi:hypothetical protein L2E82_32965 [Cichorium intybus]|uniref:Uncharacterized protein n=1 Tax=Cichorium intybus TaxID=13427 RepID=A0ACB9BJ52_CICIN|nr:hypothetical protein L2E82_32965 [Cichorium intybus]